ncbi:MAG: DNA translocase FtsK 4TM domain-containing protein [Candidatus Kapaibacteriota bacterium]
MALPPDSVVINRKRNSIIDSLFDSEEDEMIVSKSQSSKKNKAIEPEPEKESHRALAMQILGIFMALSSVLLLLSLVSYTPKDEANADMTIYDIISVLKGDPTIQAKSDTTQNWLGLFGAVFSHLMFNSTIGYFAITLPLLGFLWAKDIFFKEQIASKTLRFTGLISLIGILFSGLCGTLQLIIPSMSPEWSGLIGQFESHVLASLTGKIGALLIFLVALFLTITLGFGISIKTTIQVMIDSFMKFSMLIDKCIDFIQNRNAIQQTVQEIDEDEQYIQQSSMAVFSPEIDDEPARIIRKRTQGLNNEPIINHPSTQVPVIIRGNEQLEDDEPMFVNVTRKQRPLPKKTVPLPTEEISVKKESILPKQDIQESAPLLTLNVQDPILNTEDMSEREIARAQSMIQDEEIDYDAPTLELLTQQHEHVIKVDDDELKENARLLQEKLRTFKIEINDLQVTPGPVVTQYEFVPAAGIKISQIENLSDDIALALKARGIRIIAPVPGRGTVAIEIPNHNPSMVLFSSIIKSSKFHDVEQRLPLALGKTISGEVYCADLAKMPHLLIAGSTGAGKSVGINTVICSLLYKMHPKDLKFVIIDPKRVEMTYYGLLRNHFLALSPDVDEHIITMPQNAVAVLKSLCNEMMNRYDILAKVGQRNIVDFNTKLKEGKFKDSELELKKMPYIVCVIDELADLMLTAGKEVEEPIIRLAQLARAVGIHMIIATQRPSVDVITGLIKANFPARISYQVASKIDSRTIIDGPGADQLLGNGDMLYLPGGAPKPVRIQNSFLSTDEVENICKHISHQQGYSTPYMLPTAIDKSSGGIGGGSDSRDELFVDAARIVVNHKQGSTSLLQRYLKVGYARAARIMDELESAGIVGAPNGSKGREVYVESEMELESYL